MSEKTIKSIARASKWGNLLIVGVSLVIVLNSILSIMKPTPLQISFNIFMSLLIMILAMWIQSSINATLRYKELGKLIDALANKRGAVLVFDKTRRIDVKTLENTDIADEVKQIKYSKKHKQYFFVSPDRAYFFKGINAPVFIAYKDYAQAVSVKEAFMANIMKNNGWDRKSVEKEMRNMLFNKLVEYYLTQGLNEDESVEAARRDIINDEIPAAVKKSLQKVAVSIDNLEVEGGEENE